MTRVKPVSIASVGLKHHLDITRASHNDKGYDDFVFYIKKKIPLATTGRIFNVNRSTAVKWYKIYLKEQSDGQPNKDS